MLEELKNSLAKTFFEIGAIRFGSFKLKLHEARPEAPLSPIYVDLRILRSFPDAMDLAVKLYLEITKTLVFNIYADIPTAATPIVALLSNKTRKPMISPRMTEKDHGTGELIDGVYEAGMVVLLIDDLITKADSKLKAISIIERNKLKVNDVVVVIDREQGGIAQLEERGYKCHTAYKLTELLLFYLNTGSIDKNLFDRVAEYIYKAK
jgi:uridine monophosphate synthetase